MNEISLKLDVMVQIWRARCLWAQQQQKKTGREDSPNTRRRTGDVSFTKALCVVQELARSYAALEPTSVFSRIRKLGSSPVDVFIPIFHRNMDQ